jgi:hypothetical protein
VALKCNTELVKAGADSLARTYQDKLQVARSLTGAETKGTLKQVAKPNSIAVALKKAGLLVLLSPDPLGPIADIPGVLLLSASYVLKKKEPASIASVLKEAQLVLDGFETRV